jgi:hypothetical protein
MMKFISLFALVIFSFQSACINTQSANVEAAPSNGPAKTVLVELFTSEGCSSCPPADKELEFLAKQQPVTNADIVTLAFHVDYWDGPEWKDQFSSPLFTQRQELYTRSLKLDSAYTPQMVVGGRKDLVGTDFNKALTAIMDAAKAPAGDLTSATANGHVKLDISALPAHGQATVYVAATEDNLSSKVSGGENAGSKFRHMSVVRELRPVGVITAEESKFSADIELPYAPAWKRDEVRYVAFVQDNANRNILAAGRIAN